MNAIRWDATVLDMRNTTDESYLRDKADELALYLNNRFHCNAISVPVSLGIVPHGPSAEFNVTYDSDDKNAIEIKKTIQEWDGGNR